ncbi:MAG: sigma-70 family RNA polymerase sigma factor [Planctomycetota bacterium]
MVSRRMPESSLEPETRQSLLVRLRDRRDEQAWSEFAAVYEPVIYRMVARRGLQDADAREIVQEVLMSVMSAISSFNADDKGTFRGWLGRVTCNATIDRIRKLSSRPEVLDASGAIRRLDANSARVSATEEFEVDRRQQLFRWAASEVRQRSSETNWAAFWQTSIDGISVQDVARTLNISPGRVHVARCRVLKRIRETVRTRLEE